MSTPTVWDEDFNCYVHAASISAPNTSATVDLNARSAIRSALAAMRAARLIGRDGVSRTASVGTTTTSTALTSTDAAFTAEDVGATITGTGIPGGTTIASVTDASNAVLSQNATATGTVTATIAKTDFGGVSAQGAAVWDANRKCYVSAAAISDPSGGTTDTELRTAVVQVLNALRGGRIIAHASYGQAGPTVWDEDSRSYTWSAYTTPSGGATIDAPARTTLDSIATALRSAGLLTLD